MNDAVSDCLVTGYEPLVDGLTLPDADDRHDPAAAIKAGADISVTASLSDFPADVLGQWNIVAQSPADFILDLIDSDDRIVFACLQQIVDQRVNPPETVTDVLGQLERNGLIRSAAAPRFDWPGTIARLGIAPASLQVSPLRRAAGRTGSKPRCAGRR